MHEHMYRCGRGDPRRGKHIAEACHCRAKAARAALAHGGRRRLVGKIAEMAKERIVGFVRHCRRCGSERFGAKSADFDLISRYKCRGDCIRMADRRDTRAQNTLLHLRMLSDNAQLYVLTDTFLFLLFFVANHARF